MPGQYRGWFNSLFWASVSLEGRAPFKSIFGYESLKDEKGEEMHKSKGNAIWFDDAVEKIGADPMRLIYCLQDPSQELRFGFNSAKEPRNNLNILQNIERLIVRSDKLRIEKIEDKWIISKFNSLIRNVTSELEELHPHLATRALQEFWLNDLSRGYIQLVRDRLAENDAEVLAVLGEIYAGLMKLCAPIIPFSTEDIWQKLLAKDIVIEKSVHLCDWPIPNAKKIDGKLEQKFEKMLGGIEIGLAIRDKEGIGLRWPLAGAKISCDMGLREVEEIISRQLNIKKVEIVEGKEIKVRFDLKISPELEAEGFAREFARKIQAERKNKGLKKGEVISVRVRVNDDVKAMLEKHIAFLKERTNSNRIDFTDDKSLGKD